MHTCQVSAEALAEAAGREAAEDGEARAPLLGQTASKFKGKISRVLAASLAAKTALAIRVDALGDNSEATIGYKNRAKVKAREGDDKEAAGGEAGDSKDAEDAVEAAGSFTAVQEGQVEGAVEGAAAFVPPLEPGMEGPLSPGEMMEVIAKLHGLEGLAEGVSMERFARSEAEGDGGR
jgi:hypothetical protein